MTTLWLPNTTKHYIERIDHGTRQDTKYVVIHINQGSTKGTLEWWANPNHEADGAHLQISLDGTAYQCLPITAKAWHAGAANDHSPGIEHEGVSGQHFPHIQLAVSANRCAWIHHEFKLGRPKINKTIFPHSHGGAAWGGHLCPGPSFPWEEYEKLCLEAYMGHWGRTHT